MKPYILGKLLVCLIKSEDISYDEITQIIPSLVEETEFEESNQDV